MSRALHGRLRRLEDQFRPAIEALRKSAELPSPSASQWIASKLDEFGFVRDPNESLAESLGRAMGWNMLQLRTFLERRAAGLE